MITNRQTFRDYIEMTAMKTGTYACLRLTDESKEEIGRFIALSHILNALPIEELHSTVIYSRDVNARLIGKPMTASGKIIGFKTFESEGKQILSILLDAPEIVAIHKELRKRYNLSHHYDEFIPHITISYDAGDVSNLTTENLPQTVDFKYLHVEDLDTDWESQYVTD